MAISLKLVNCSFSFSWVASAFLLDLAFMFQYDKSLISQECIDSGTSSLDTLNGNGVVFANVAQN